MPFVPAEEIREKFGYFDIFSVRRAVQRHGIKSEVKDGVFFVDYDEFYTYYANKAPNNTHISRSRMSRYTISSLLSMRTGR